MSTDNTYKNATHAVTIQLDGIPQGYFPIGTYSELEQLIEDNKGAAKRSGTLKGYSLVQLPACANDGISEDVIIERAKEVLNGDVDVNVSSKDVVDEANEKVIKPAKNALSSALALAKKAVENNGKVDPIDLLPAGAALQQVLGGVADIKEKLGGKFESALRHTQTDEYLRNDRGVFVTQAWLDNPDNAKYLLTLKAPSNDPAAKGISTPKA